MKTGTRKSNGEGSIYQRADERWCAQILVPGAKKPKYFYGKTRNAVATKLRIFSGLQYTEPWDTGVDLTVEEFIWAWFRNVKTGQLKPTSCDRLESTIKNQIVPRIGSCIFPKLTTMQIQNDVINDLFSLGYSYSQIKKAYNALNGCCKYALLPTVRKLTYNPVSGVIMPPTEKFEYKEIHWLNEPEIKRFIEECKARCKNGNYRFALGYGMILILNTGLRLSEALAIRWKDVDFKTRHLSVVNNVVMAVDRKTSSKKRVPINQKFLKTKSSRRIIPLNNTAMDALAKIKELRYFGEDSYILCTETGEQNKPGNFRRTYNAIIKRAGIEHCGIHTLRHTFATELFRKGVKANVVSKLLGHASTDITYNIYIHVIQEQKTVAVSGNRRNQLTLRQPSLDFVRSNHRCLCRKENAYVGTSPAYHCFTRAHDGKRACTILKLREKYSISAGQEA